VLSDKIASRIFLSEKYILALEMASQASEPALCQLYRHTVEKLSRRKQRGGRVDESVE